VPKRGRGRVEGPSRGGRGGICQCVPPGKVGPWVKGGGEDEAQPLQVGLWVEELIFQLHREGARWLMTPGGPPVDQFGLGNGEGDVDWGSLSLERREGLLKEANVGPVRGLGHRNSKIVDVGDTSGKNLNSGS